uniref:Uncharacterized protein n=1 Tax=Macrostomum lignano TaxID=282301 RepID=A0A1I8FQ36_9PLAT
MAAAAAACRTRRPP